MNISLLVSAQYEVRSVWLEKLMTLLIYKRVYWHHFILHSVKFWTYICPAQFGFWIFWKHLNA